MKKTIILVILSFFPFIVFCQNVVPEDLDDPDHGVRFKAIKIIVEEELEEFIPEIQERLFDQPNLTLQFAFLDALFSLDDSEIEQWAIDFIENADNLQESDDPLYYKVKATNILFELGNYSTVQFVFELLNRDLNHVDNVSLVLLRKIILYVPQFSQDAQTELVRIFNAELQSEIRFIALKILYEINYSEIIDICLNAVINDISPTIRIYSNVILTELNYSGLHDIYYQRLSVDPEPTLRSKYAGSLLIVFGEPSDLKTVIDYQPNEPDELIRNFIGGMIDDFIPPRPTVPTSEMITNLIGYTAECYQYFWLVSYFMYLPILEDIEKAYAKEDIELLCEKLNELLDFVESQHGTPLLTEEGYKFMHYHGTYIKDNVEDEFGVLCDDF